MVSPRLLKGRVYICPVRLSSGFSGPQMCSETPLGVLQVPKTFLYIQNTNQIDISNDFVKKIHFYGKFKIQNFLQRIDFLPKSLQNVKVAQNRSRRSQRLIKHVSDVQGDVSHVLVHLQAKVDHDELIQVVRMLQRVKFGRKYNETNPSQHSDDLNGFIAVHFSLYQNLTN